MRVSMRATSPTEVTTSGGTTTKTAMAGHTNHVPTTIGARKVLATVEAIGIVAMAGVGISHMAAAGADAVAVATVGIVAAVEAGDGDLRRRIGASMMSTEMQGKQVPTHITELTFALLLSR